MSRIVQIGAPTGIILLALLESVLLLCAYYIGLYASWVEVDLTLAQIFENAPKALFFWAVISSWMFIFGLYRKDSVQSGMVFIPRLIVSFAVSYACLALLFYSFPILVIWRAIMVVAIPVAFVLIVLFRRSMKDLLNADALKRQVAVIGSGEQARRIEELHNSDFAGFYSAGYIPVAGEEPAVPKDRIISPGNDLYAALRENNVEQLVVASLHDTALPTRALVDCRLKGIKIIDYQTFFSRETGRIDLDFLRPDWFFVEQGFHAAAVYRWLKRGSDLLLGTFIAIFCAPLFCLLALAVFMEDRGPVLYRQRRVGFAGTPFEMLKFRSMQPDAEADGVAVWSVDDDPRVTHTGRVMRFLRLDELPQVWNILKGDMSFVGPRPERPQFVEQLAQAHQYFPDRHAVKPGLTGWAQINFPYANSETDAARKLEYDLYYVKYGNILMDIVITMQTARVVLWPSSAN